MIKQFLLFAGLLFTIQLTAQTGIGTPTPDPSAKLDVFSTNKGFLPPRVSLTGINDNTTIPTPATGLLVYCKGDAGLSSGYYFWNGTTWATIATSEGSNSVEYVSVQASSDLTITAGTSVKFNTTLAGNIPYDVSTGFFTLSAGKTYRISGFVSLAGGQITSTGAEAITVWRTSSGSNIGNYAQILSANTNFNSNGQGVTDFIYTPITNTSVSLYVNSITNNVGFRGGYTSATITQVGSSATINPWTLSGINTFNTTGNVGIGTSSPSEKLDVSGNVKATNFIGNGSQITGVSTNITYGEIDVPQALAVATGFVDLVNIPLPSAGKYKITYVVRASITTSGTLAVLALRNGSNTQISGTEAMAVYNLSNVQVTCTQVCVVNPTAAETFKLSVWTQAGSGSFNVINDGNGRSKVLWEKIQ